MKEIARMRNLARRNALTPKEVAEKSLRIKENFLGLPEFQDAESVMLFYGVKNEPETKSIIEKALSLGKLVSLPLTDFGKRQMKAIQVGAMEELRETRFGLVEPTGTRAVEPSSIGLIAMPGVAFDRQGNRVGWGKGFYDSMLRRTSTKVVLAGICFEENLEESLPCESHDVKMNIIVTDRRVVRCEK